MIEPSDEAICAKIVYNITRRRGRYTNRHFAVAGFPQHLRSLVERNLEAMVKEGLLRSFKGGECVGVNMQRYAEMKRLVEMHLKTISGDLY